MLELIGNYVNLWDETVFKARMVIHQDRIFTIKKIGEEDPKLSYFLPGFVDAHVHIESSLLPPSEFAKLAAVHGTVATVSDPHEIANVLGVKGVRYMIENGETVPFKFFFGAPSCVPATTFETAGATVSADDIRSLLADPRIPYLAEMMNFPGVIFEDPEVMEKLKIAQEFKKPIDGHAPGLRGQNAQNYFSKGISTDHECYTLEEAQEKIDLGVKILIREGSAARNFDALIPLAKNHADQMMFCSDDKHPDGLLEGHINVLVKRAVKSGVPLFSALRMACIQPVRHYGLPVGLLREGDPADFIEVDNLQALNVLSTYIDGICVAKDGKNKMSSPAAAPINHFNALPLQEKDLQFSIRAQKIRVIGAVDGQIVSEKRVKETAKIGHDDVLKIVVYNRYKSAPPAVAYIQGFGLKQGAIASSVAHDSHNIVAVGCDDKSIVEVVNALIKEKGGLAAVSKDKKMVLPLAIAGLMSTEEGSKVAQDYIKIDSFSKETLGSTLQSPFMSLSFMALLVIPSLKLSDKGLFDGDKFEYTSVGIEE
jgi:adenine deaminase